MTVQTVIAVGVVVLFGAAQYTLMIQALRDLVRRPRVRGGNKAAWALVILCFPILGPMVYSWMGPTSLLRRPDASDGPVTRHAMHYAGRTPPRRNVTPISDARARRAGNATPPRTGSRRGTGTGS